MTYLEALEALTERVRAYRASPEARATAARLNGLPVDGMIVRSYVMPMLDGFDGLPKGFADALHRMFNDWAREAVPNLVRKRHMHDAANMEVFSQDVGDALLADFINFTAVTGNVDYAIYAEDVR